jgi:hypothetical protein
MDLRINVKLVTHWLPVNIATGIQNPHTIRVHKTSNLFCGVVTGRISSGSLNVKYALVAMNRGGVNEHGGSRRVVVSGDPAGSQWQHA